MPTTSAEQKTQTLQSLNETWIFWVARTGVLLAYVAAPIILLTLFRMPELVAAMAAPVAAVGGLVFLALWAGAMWLRCRLHHFLALLVCALALLKAHEDSVLWTPPPGTYLKGRTAVITGGNSGLGLAAARELVGLGATVVVTCRSKARCEPALADIRQFAGNGGTVESAVLSLTSARSAADLAQELRERHPRIDLLVNNAGGTPTFNLTDDGLEDGLGGMHLGHMTLTLGLMPSLKAAAVARKEPSRVVMVASHAGVAAASGMSGPAFEDDFMESDGEGDLRGERTRAESFFSEMKAYGRAKLANALFAFELTRRGSDAGVISHALHTGGVHTAASETSMKKMFSSFPGMSWLIEHIYLPALWRTPKQGASTLLFAALATEPERMRQGGEWVDGMCQPVLHSNDSEMKALRSADEKWAARLWKVSERLIKSSPASAVLEHTL